MTTKFHPAAQKAHDAQRQRKAQQHYEGVREELCVACQDYVLHYDEERVDPETETALLDVAFALVRAKEAVNAE